MAANLDRAETSLTAVSDIAYIRGIDGSGNSVRISKADLASVLGVTDWGSTHFVLRQNANKKHIRVLLANTAFNAYCFSGTIECISMASGNPANVCCHVYLTADYNRVLSKSVIVPFDGVENRQIVDYTYNGATYKCIEFTVGQYDSTVITVSGYSNNRNSVMVVSEPL